MAVKPGDIVFAYIPDPDGKPCLDDHPAMILRTVDGAPNVWLVGITSKFKLPIPKAWLRLPWHPNRHPVTGLYKDSVLKTNWTYQKAIIDLSAPIGVVPPDIFQEAGFLIWDAVKQAEANRQQG